MIVLRVRFVREEVVLQATVNLLTIIVIPIREGRVMVIKQYIVVMVRETVKAQILIMTQTVMVKVVGQRVIQIVLKKPVQGLATVREIVEIVLLQIVTMAVVNAVVGQLVLAAILAVPGVKKVTQEPVRRAGVMTNLSVDVERLVVTIGKMRVVVKEIVQALKCIKLEIAEPVPIQNHNVFQILVVELLTIHLRPV